ncbi:GDP-mannose 4,6-dehydratase, partial [Candidatus Gracilibacteria bacterium]|nr:GDP-mannose 4,6-dehydratase [Candidatus Gracilibacteria bacterium]
HTVREFVEASAKLLGMDLVWEGKDIEEKGIDRNTGEVIIEIDARYFRPAEVDLLVGDYTKAKTVLGWKPSTDFQTLVRRMIKNDLELVGLKLGEIYLALFTAFWRDVMLVGNSLFQLIRDD